MILYCQYKNNDATVKKVDRQSLINNLKRLANTCSESKGDTQRAELIDSILKKLG